MSSAASVKITQYAPIFGALRQRVTPTVGAKKRIIGGTRGLDAIAHELRGVGQRFTGDGIRALGNGSGAIGGRLGAALARQRLEDEETY